MTEVRVFYSKTGKMKFVSHLDMNRLMARVIKKAGVPVWYTEGFNPHPYMTFSMPLSLGHESLCESFDIRLVEDVDTNELKSRMNAVMPQGIEITSISAPRFKPTDITSADYIIKFYTNDKGFAAKLDAFIKRETIIAEKSGKKGKITEIDLAKKMLSKSVETTGYGCNLFVSLPSGTTENINPALLIGAFEATVLDMPPIDIIRTKLYCLEEEYK